MEKEIDFEKKDEIKELNNLSNSNITASFDEDNSMKINSPSFANIGKIILETTFEKELNELKDPILAYSKLYTEIECLGQGGHGVVNKVKNNLTGEFFAAKILKADDEEIQINIVKIYEKYENKTKGQFVFIMEFLDYLNLRKFLTINKEISEKNIKNLFIQFLEALDYLHINKITHRDISPKNIMISKDGNSLKIIDFGVAKEMIKEENNSEYKMFTPCGVPQFRAPEIMEGSGYSEKSDIWLSGLFLYEMLTKKNVTTKKILKAFEDNTFENNLDNNKELIDLLTNLLNINPEKRITAKEALKHPWLY